MLSFWVTECKGPVNIYERNPVAFRIAFAAVLPEATFVLSALNAGGKNTIAVALDHMSREIARKPVKAKL